MSNNLLSSTKDITTHPSTISSAMSVNQQDEQAIVLREQELVDMKKNLLNKIINILG